MSKYPPMQTYKFFHYIYDVKMESYQEKTYQITASSFKVAEESFERDAKISYDYHRYETIK